MPGLQFEAEYGKTFGHLIKNRVLPTTVLEARERTNLVQQGWCQTYEDPNYTAIDYKLFTVMSHDSVPLDLWRVAPISVLRSTKPTPAILFFHPGGHIFGDASFYKPYMARYARALGIPFFAINYRKAPEHPFPYGANDAFAAFKYLVNHCTELNIDLFKIMVMGDSSGGGLAAGLCQRLRDINFKIRPVKQILTEPMLYDRTILEDSHARTQFLVWTTKENEMGWTSVLGKDAGRPDVKMSPWIVPARATDFSNLPSVYIDIGSLDLFLEESLEYAKNLSAAGVEVEIHVWPGLPHCHDMYGSQTTQKAMGSRIAAIRKGID